MTNYREILRVQSLGLNKTEIVPASAAHATPLPLHCCVQAAAVCSGLCRTKCLTKISLKSCSPVHPGNRPTRCRITPTCTGKCKRAASR